MTAHKPVVLVVEDDPLLADAYSRILAAEPVAVETAGTLAAARAAIARAAPAALLIDVNLPDGNGIAFLKEAGLAADDVAVIAMTANGSINTAVEAMQAGAQDFIVKPFGRERLLTTLRNALERRRLARALKSLGPAPEGGGFEGFVGDDLAMRALYQMIEQAARSKATVFITGESGTGKELTAEAIHRRSDRRGGPFVALNCGAIPRDLIESEIFGHVRGAFTGATSDREGAALRANGGTLFLDEICEMDLALQTKLLRFLQTGIVQKVGSDRPQKVDVRIVCATNRDPLAEVEAGRFREDLYYRLHVVPIRTPPLRERGDDVLLVARHFLTEMSREEGKQFKDFSPEAAALLKRHHWPGNVRELQNAVRRTVVLHDGERVEASMLPELAGGPAPRAVPASAAEPAAPEPPVSPAASAGARAAIRPLAEVERLAIEAAVAACGGNMTEAAQRLGISVKTIYRKRQGWAEEPGSAA